MLEVDPVKAGMHAGRLERITEHFEKRYVQPGRIAGCQITVARAGHVAYHRSLGLADRERGVPLADDTVFRIYSMTKPIASVALMQLHERGLLTLLEPIHHFLPSWSGQEVGVVHPDGTVSTVPARRPVNVRDLLTHTSGLAGGIFPNHPIDRAFVAARAEAARRTPETLETVSNLLGQHPLKFQPGTHWNYGISTDVVARLVEVVSGRRFDDYLRTEIFRPLGMVDTGFFVPEEDHKRLAACYRFQPDAPPRLMRGQFSQGILAPRNYLSGASGLVSTSADYLAFCRMLVNRGELAGHRILGRTTLELMTANHLPDGRVLHDLAVGGFGHEDYEGTGFGLGFAISLGPAATALPGSAGVHSWGGAAGTTFWIDPVEDLVVVFMTQLFPFGSYPFRDELRALVYQALDQ
jgi:CubicO group peptidase (beta-lactamase class C family)